MKILINQGGHIMSFTINTNTNANYALVYGKQNERMISSSLEKLSTGLRLNRSADDK